MIKTIDVAGVRALHDAHGARAAGKLLLRATRENATRTALEELEKAGGHMKVVRGHARLWTPLGERGERPNEQSRINGTDAVIVLGDAELPDAIVAALPGSPLTALVGHPLLDDKMTITTVVRDDRLLYVRISGYDRPLRQVADALRRGERP